MKGVGTRLFNFDNPKKFYKKNTKIENFSR